MTSLTNHPLSARMPVKQKSDDLTFYKRYSTDLEKEVKKANEWAAYAVFIIIGQSVLIVALIVALLA